MLLYKAGAEILAKSINGFSLASTWKGEEAAYIRDGIKCKDQSGEEPLF